LLNHVASNGTYEQTLLLYIEFIQKKYYEDHRVYDIMLEKLHENGTEESFKLQKQIINKMNSKNISYRHDYIHFLTALKLKKYDYIIRKIPRTTSIYYANIRMIALVKLEFIDEACDSLREYIQFNANHSISILYDETVNDLFFFNSDSN
jgi:hypothetical protein